MEEAPEDSKESYSAHANGMYEWMDVNKINWLYENTVAVSTSIKICI